MGRRSRHTKPKSRKDKFIIGAVAAAGGIDRVDHFAAGRSAREWRPYKTVTKNGKAHANKRGCRGRVRRD